MEPVIFVEILDAHGHVAQRQRFDALPIRIGRAYENEVILDDGYVSPEHARIVMGPDECLVIEDLGSTNGIFWDSERKRRSPIVLRPGDSVRVGRTTLRIGVLNQRLAPALVEAKGWTRLLSVGERPAVAWSAVAVATALMAIPEALSSTAPEWLGESIGVALGYFLILAIWAGIWALGSRVSSHRYRFLQHLALVAILGALLVMAGTLVEYLEFMFWPSEVATAFEGFMFAGAFVLLLYGHLTILERLRPARRMLVSVGIAILFALVAVQVSSVGSADFSSEVEVLQTLKPIGPPWVATTDLDAFLEGTFVVQEQEDALAADDGSALP